MVTLSGNVFLLIVQLSITIGILDQTTFYMLIWILYERKYFIALLHKMVWARGTIPKPDIIPHKDEPFYTKEKIFLNGLA
jgi:hypothetical protein